MCLQLTNSVIYDDNLIADIQQKKVLIQLLNKHKIISFSVNRMFSYWKIDIKGTIYCPKQLLTTTSGRPEI